MKYIESFLDYPENIGPIFHRSEKKFEMYVKYCQNKPKSEYIVSEHFEYFEVSQCGLLFQLLQFSVCYQFVRNDFKEDLKRTMYT